MKGLRTLCLAIALTLPAAACVLGPKQDDPAAAEPKSDVDSGFSVDAPGLPPPGDSAGGPGTVDGSAGDSAGLKDGCDAPDADGGDGARDARCGDGGDAGDGGDGGDAAPDGGAGDADDADATRGD